MTGQDTFQVIVTYDSDIAPLVINGCLGLADSNDNTIEFLHFRLRGGAEALVKTDLVRSIETRPEN